MRPRYRRPCLARIHKTKKRARVQIIVYAIIFFFCRLSDIVRIAKQIHSRLIIMIFRGNSHDLRCGSTASSECYRANPSWSSSEFTLYFFLSSTLIKRYRGIYAENTVIFNGTAREFNVAFSAITERIYRGERNCNRESLELNIYYCCLIEL